MVFELRTRPKLIISILNYINSSQTVVYTTTFTFFFLFLATLDGFEFTNCRCVGATSQFVCANKERQSNKRRRMRGVKQQHHKPDCCRFYNTQLSRAWLRVGASRATICSRDQWERNNSDVRSPSRYFSLRFWLVFVAATHIFFGIMRSFFYGILLSVVCFST